MARNIERALAAMPGGVSSPVRSFKSVGGDPVFIAKAEGAYLYAEDGKKYLDLVGSWGPALLGHAQPQIVEAVTRQAQLGLSYGAPTWAEVELAELIKERVPVAQVRFVSTGTEATMTALRLARAATGRDLIVKFEGCYHGHSDGLLVAAGSGLAGSGVPDSSGVPATIAAQTIVLPYNDFDALSELFAERGTEIAAVITEAAPANMGVVPPRPGFNLAIRELTKTYGALFIYDEVLTGFRASATGYWGIEQESSPYLPDIFCFGKVIGGGLPLAALAGSKELMELLAPVGPVYQAGTLSGNPLAVAAGIATLQLADPEVYDQISRISARFRNELVHAFFPNKIPYTTQRAGSLFSTFFSNSPVFNFQDVLATDLERYRKFFHGMLARGVHLPPSPFEAWFISAAHTEADCEFFAQAAKDTSEEIASQ